MLLDRAQQNELASLPTHDTVISCKGVARRRSIFNADHCTCSQAGVVKRNPERRCINVATVSPQSCHARFKLHILRLALTCLGLWCLVEDHEHATVVSLQAQRRMAQQYLKVRWRKIRWLTNIMAILNEAFKWPHLRVLKCALPWSAVFLLFDIFCI